MSDKHNLDNPRREAREHYDFAVAVASGLPNGWDLTEVFYDIQYPGAYGARFASLSHWVELVVPYRMLARRGSANKVRKAIELEVRLAIKSAIGG